MLSHGNLAANSEMISAAFGTDENLRGVGWLPLFHDMGLIGHVLQPVYVGALSVLMSPHSFLQHPVRWLQAISDWRAMVSGGPTYAYDLCNQRIRDDQIDGLDLGSWRVAYCGSEKIRATVLGDFGRRFGGGGFRSDALTPCYGLAEATLMVSATEPGRPLKTETADRESIGVCGSQTKVVSCGRAWGGQTAVIVDPVTRERLPDGMTGEIYVRGPSVARGYWLRPQLSTDTFAARIGNETGAYLRTGDLGFMRNDELFVVGRMKDTIVIRGVSIAAEDIETSMAESHEFFRTLPAAAFAIESGGEEHVVVVQEIDRLRRVDADANKAVATAFEHVTRNHGVRLFDLILVRAGALPRTSSGKIQRHRCRSLYETSGFERLNAVRDFPWFGVNRRIEARESVE
jgi:acyl-CoA synthetase (AMP-forming)/AMP-acid ligase II